ncbi:asparagine synthase-related protein [Streptosporangium sp. OZ121]|uniref:asparagine synthase-related protein n=1 Tax=Streptosporangium sp. OZ121 TaxID=3444183 RepID=UPI003F7ADB84
MTLRYTASPYVCGAIGPWDARVLASLLDASPAGVRRLHTSPFATLYATAGLETWSAGPRSGVLWWARAHDLPQPGTWQEAAERRLAAGLVTDATTAVLHTDALGLSEVYVREVGGAIYFACRIDPLLSLDDRPLHVDWSTWANVFVLLTPVGEQTPFEEIRRLEGGTGWRAGCDGIGRVAFQPSWRTAAPRTVRPEEVAELVSAQIPRRTDQAITVALSGGWDSRLLAGLAVRHAPGRVHAWTTSNDDGLDHDMRCAESVASVLGMPHRVVTPGPEAWLDDHEEVWGRVQYQTLHHVWQLPLARAARTLNGPLLDGLAGDALFRNRPYYAEMESSGHRQARRSAWSALTGGRLDHPELFAPGVRDMLRDLSQESFDKVMTPLDGHHALAAASRLLRTSRSIGSSPHWVLGPEIEVGLPFVHPEVIAAGFHMPPAQRRDNGFYQAMIEYAGGDIARLPSTHDVLDDTPRGVPRKRSSAALAAVVRKIEAVEPALRLLGPRLTAALADPAARYRQAQWSVPLTTLQWVAMLAHWQWRYGSRLAPGSLI